MNKAYNLQNKICKLFNSIYPSYTIHIESLFKMSKSDKMKLNYLRLMNGED
jgi:hypothetical protein